MAHATTPDRIEDVHRLLAETLGGLLVADASGALVGRLIAAWDGWRGNMYRLVVPGSTVVAASAWRSWAPARSTCTGRGAYRITALVADESRRQSGRQVQSRGHPNVYGRFVELVPRASPYCACYHCP
jgi:hypothetical protein